MELELGLDPDDATRLTRLALLAPLRSGQARSRAVRIVWHDSPDRALGAAGPGAGRATPAVAAGAAAARTRRAGRPARRTGAGDRSRPRPHSATTLPDPLVPLAAFEGRASSLGLATEQGPVGLTLLNGAVRAFAGEHRISRIRLEGGGARCRLWRSRWPASFASPCRVPAWLAKLLRSPPAWRRHRGGRARPSCPPGCRWPEAFAYVVGHLSDVILHFAPPAADGRMARNRCTRCASRFAGCAPRSRCSAARCSSPSGGSGGCRPEGACRQAGADTRLGRVRDRDGRRGRPMRFPREQRLQRLLAAAERRRRACHDELRAFLGSTEFRRLGIELACLAGGQDWQAALGDAEQERACGVAGGIRRPRAGQAAEEADADG